jgi:hypothetical protein
MVGKRVREKPSLIRGLSPVSANGDMEMAAARAARTFDSVPHHFPLTVSISTCVSV